MERSRIKNYAAWALQILLSAFFVMAAAPKLMGNPEVVESFRQWGMPEKSYLLVGALELLGAVGLLIPHTVVYAAGGLVLLMIGATGTHFAHGEWERLLMPVAPMLLLLLVGYWRISELLAHKTAHTAAPKAEMQ